MKLLVFILAAFILIYIGIFVAAVIPYHVYLKKNKESLKKMGITTVTELMEDVKRKKRIKKEI